MDDGMTERRRRNALGGRSLAAALGLVAAAFLIDRLVPPPGNDRSSLEAGPGSEDAPPPSKDLSAPDSKRGVSVAGLAFEGKARGRRASSPLEIPARGWKDILLRVYANIGNHRILALAAGITYYSILAIFPAWAALVAIYGIFTDPGSIAKHLDDISGFVPGGAIDVARAQLTRVASKGSQTLGGWSSSSRCSAFRHWMIQSGTNCFIALPQLS